MKKNNKILNDLQSALDKVFDEYKTAELKLSGKLPYTKKDELESWIHDLKEFERYKPYLKVFNNNLKNYTLNTRNGKDGLLITYN